MSDHDQTTSKNAEWKEIQQRTLTRWCNEHLKTTNDVIYDLKTDLCDGTKLIKLLELLANKKVKKYNKSPKNIQQKVDTATVALNFIKKEIDKIELLNISK